MTNLMLTDFVLTGPRNDRPRPVGEDSAYAEQSGIGQQNVPGCSLGKTVDKGVESTGQINR